MNVTECSAKKGGGYAAETTSMAVFFEAGESLPLVVTSVLSLSTFLFIPATALSLFGDLEPLTSVRRPEEVTPFGDNRAGFAPLTSGVPERLRFPASVFNRATREFDDASA
jgi:hypothetical protein